MPDIMFSDYLDLMKPAKIDGKVDHDKMNEHFKTFSALSKATCFELSQTMADHLEIKIYSFTKAEMAERLLLGKSIPYGEYANRDVFVREYFGEHHSFLIDKNGERSPISLYTLIKLQQKDE